MSEIWVAAVAGTVVGVGGSLVAANQTKKAIQGQQGILSRLEYTPIDIAKIQKDASDAARQNAISSLALERELTPDIADTRANLSKSVSDQLKLGGRLPPDVANLVSREARVQGGLSGGFGGTPGVTAATLGTTALGLLNQRQAAAMGLLAANPAPISGLDPASIANLEVADATNANQFALSKAGAQGNLINSNAAANNAAIGSATSSLQSLIGLYGNLANKPAAPASRSISTSNLPTFNSTIPQYNASLIPGG